MDITGFNMVLIQFRCSFDTSLIKSYSTISNSITIISDVEEVVVQYSKYIKSLLDCSSSSSITNVIYMEGFIIYYLEYFI